MSEHECHGTASTKSECLRHTHRRRHKTFNAIDWKMFIPHIEL